MAPNYLFWIALWHSTWLALHCGGRWERLEETEASTGRTCKSQPEKKTKGWSTGFNSQEHLVPSHHPRCVPSWLCSPHQCLEKPGLNWYPAGVDCFAVHQRVWDLWPLKDESHRRPSFKSSCIMSMLRDLVLNMCILVRRPQSHLRTLKYTEKHVWLFIDQISNKYVESTSWNIWKASNVLNWSSLD